MLDKKLIVAPLNENLDKNGNHILTHPNQYNLNTKSNKTYQPLVMFVGGAKDSTLKPVLGSLFTNYNKNNEHYQDIGYATYIATEALKSITLHWLSKNQKVVFVGHSYGGDAVMDIARELSDLGKK